MSKSDFFFLATLAAIPIQLNKVFWPDYAYVLGLPIDYLALTIYLIDIILVGYLITFIALNRKNLRKIFSDYKSLLLPLAAFNGYLLINSISTSISPLPSLFFTLKFLLFSIYCIFAVHTIKNKNVIKYVTKIFTFSLVWQSALIVSEFLVQHSIGLWFLGERSFDSSTNGIAHSQIFAKELLRPYGTFPHPNVAAAFFVLTFLIIEVISRQKTKLTPILALISLILTYSKTAVAIIVLASMAYVKNLKQVLIIIGAMMLSVFIFLKVLPTSQIPSISERLVLIQSALDISLKNPLFGVGNNNFIQELSKYNLYSLTQIRLLPPVHNVFLLVLAQNGIIGLLIITWFLYSVAKNANNKPKVALFLAILIFASFDHFFWTLEQGQLLFFTAIAFIVS